MKEYTSRRTEVVPFEFRLDGSHWVTEGSPTLLDLCEFARCADLDVQDPRGVTAIADIFTNALGPRYDEFRAHCRLHSTEADVLIEILQDLIIHVTGRNLDRSSPSSAGTNSTGGTSRAGLRTAVLLPERIGQELTEDDIVRWRQAVQEAAEKDATGDVQPPS